MSEIPCPSCGEPWDPHHLKHDAVWETDLTDNAAKIYSDEGCHPFTKEVRTALERDGWAFPSGASSILMFIRCPACRPDDRASSDAIARREALQILGDDVDAIQAELEVL